MKKLVLKNTKMALLSMTALSMLLLLTFGIQTGRTLYFESALIIALLGSVGTIALAKFIMRGEVIE